MQQPETARGKWRQATRQRGNGVKEEDLLWAPEILWTCDATFPGLTTGSIRPVWMTEHDILQKVEVRPLKRKRTRTRTRTGLNVDIVKWSM